MTMIIISSSAVRKGVAIIEGTDKGLRFLVNYYKYVYFSSEKIREVKARLQIYVSNSLV